MHMDVGQLKYDLRVVRRGYRQLSGILRTANLLLLLLAGLFTFLLLAYEPSSDWHSTVFTLDCMNYRYTRSGGVLDLYATDGRCFVVNQNDEAIQHQLVVGQTYSAVYSDDLFHDILQSLHDGTTEYLNLEASVNKYRISCRIAWILAIVFWAALVLLNVLYSAQCIREEHRRMLSYQKRKQQHR